MGHYQSDVRCDECGDIPCTCKEKDGTDPNLTLRESALIIKRHADKKCGCNNDHHCRNRIKRLAVRILWALGTETTVDGD